MNPVSQGLDKDVLHSERKWLRRLTLTAVIACFVLTPALFAQDAVPIEILSRTLYIKTLAGTGTAFKLDHNGKMYLVTARHVVAGLPTEKATLQVWKVDKWEDYPTVRILFPPSEHADIAVFETDETVLQPYTITAAQGSEGGTFGQQLWFLGYPDAWHTRNLALPFIKRGTMSAVDPTDPNAVVYYIDGFNNPGFSGGPIVFWDFSAHAYRILGVVQGYNPESAKIAVNGISHDTNILVNSGILTGYSISHVFQAIDQPATK
jgi:Trypsin-like peptidase domain